MGRSSILAMWLVTAVSISACTTAPKENIPDYSRHSEAEVRRHVRAVEPVHSPAVNLLAEHGWTAVGVISEAQEKMPEDFLIRPLEFRWRDVVEFSSDVGLDLNGYAGRTLRFVSFLVEDTTGARLQHYAEKFYFRGIVLMDEDVPVGAWISPASRDGQPTVGGGGYSLTGKTLEQITGMPFQEYLKKHRAP